MPRQCGMTTPHALGSLWRFSSTRQAASAALLCGRTSWSAPGVVQLTDPERNYHVFYQASLPPAERHQSCSFVSRCRAKNSRTLYTLSAAHPAKHASEVSYLSWA